MVPLTDPVEYRWSSYAAKVLGKEDLIIDLYPTYLAMGDLESDRPKAYKEYVLDTIHDLEIKLIRDALQRGQLTGSDRFRVAIEK